jgi:lysophospholipase L1-like esterase
MRTPALLLAILLSGLVPGRLAAESPDVPAPRTKAYPWMSLEKWRDFHAGDLARGKEGPVEVLFLGDSITEAWEKDGAAVWEEFFAPLGAANFGIGGDTTQNVLWRITEGGALENVRPKVVVVLIGTNNIGLLGDDPPEVVRGIGAVVQALRKKLPDARILLLGLFPRGVPGDSYRRDVEETNRLLAAVAKDDPMVRHFRIWDEFTDGKGNLPPDLMPDKLHLSREGYRVWAKAVTPVLREMLAVPGAPVADAPAKRPFKKLFSPK